MRFSRSIPFLSTLFCVVTFCNARGSGYPIGQRGIWSAEKANQWYAGKGWLRGCDFIPSSLPLLEKVFNWGEEVNPEQPLLAGVWDDRLDVLNACTEYMARLRNSTFFNIMPILRKEDVAAINWGLVTGKTNTKYAWDTPMPDGAEPKIWFHDIFRPDGTAFDQKELAFVKQLTMKDPSDTIPLGGNAWRHRPGRQAVAGDSAGDPTAAGDSTGGYIDNAGIGGWTDSAVYFDVWLRTTVPEDLRVWMIGSVPEGKSRLSVGVGMGGRPVLVDLAGRNAQPHEAGVFTLGDTGYQRIRIRALHRTGPRYADISAIVVQGPALVGRTAFVPNNEGNFFHWGRRGPSVHLNYPLPAGYDASWFYNEVTVPPGQDIQGSYFMACGFGQGYFGMQVNSPTERHILFSVWSPFETDDPAAIPDSQRIRLLDKGADVHTGAFGNEGAGGQSYLNYPWKAGHTYRFLLHAQPVADRHTVFTAWWYAPEEGQWRLIASFSRPQTSTGLTDLYSFLENFEPELGDRRRTVLFNHGWAGDSTGHWVSLHRARFTVDNTGRKGYRMDYGGGVRDNSFYLENDGFFNEYTPAGIWLDRSADSGGRGPDIELPR